MAIDSTAFAQAAVETDAGMARGGRVFRKSSPMAATKPFDYSRARKWAPQADFNDLATFYPSEVEKHGVRPQEELLALYEKYLGLWLDKMPTSKQLQEAAAKYFPRTPPKGLGNARSAFR